MKTALESTVRRRGILLFEALGYMVVLTMVLGVGTALLYRAWATHFALNRNAEDIVRALNTGELWRSDVRAATGPIISRDQELHIPSAHGEIIYQLKNGTVSRTAPGQQPHVLANVKSSEIQPVHRSGINGWRWELELNHDHKKVQFKPLFTFEAVAGVAQKQ
jgi:hypothetical protein